MKLAQCLCPQRHSILAFTDAEDLLTEPELLNGLKSIIATAIARDPDLESLALLNKWGVPHMNAWCALCGAPWQTWMYEVGVMKESDPEIAIEQLRACEDAQRQTADILKRAGLAYDAKRN